MYNDKLVKRELAKFTLLLQETQTMVNSVLDGIIQNGYKEFDIAPGESSVNSIRLDLYIHEAWRAEHDRLFDFKRHAGISKLIQISWSQLEMADLSPVLKSKYATNLERLNALNNQYSNLFWIHL